MPPHQVICPSLSPTLHIMLPHALTVARRYLFAPIGDLLIAGGLPPAHRGPEARHGGGHALRRAHPEGPLSSIPSWTHFTFLNPLYLRGYARGHTLPSRTLCWTQSTILYTFWAHSFFLCTRLDNLHLPGHSPEHTPPSSMLPEHTVPLFTLSWIHFAFLDTLLDTLRSSMKEATRSAELIREVPT